MKENGYIIPSFEDFVFLKEHLVYTNVSLETGKQNDKLINHIAVLNEDSYSEFQSLSEKERYRLDDFIWECIIEAALNDEDLNEGFFKNIVKGVSNMSKKSLNYAKKVVNNIGTLFKDLLAYVKKFFAECVKKGEELSKEVWNGVKKKVEDKIADKFKIVNESKVLNEGDINAKTANEELAHYKECKDFVKNKAIAAAMESTISAGQDAMKNAAGNSKEEIPNLDKRISQELKGGKENKKPVKESSFYRDLLVRAINEIRADENFDMEEFVTIAEYNSLHEEADSPAEAGEEKKKSLADKIKSGLSIGNILSIIVSGAVWAFEQLVKALSNGALNKFAKYVEIIGGPKAIKYVSIGTIIATILGLAVELWSTLYHGDDVLGAIAHGLHAVNPAYWLKVGANLIVPGSGTLIQIVALSAAGYIGVTHILHSIKGHEHMEDKESDKDKDDKEKEEK